MGPVHHPCVYQFRLRRKVQWSTETADPAQAAQPAGYTGSSLATHDLVQHTKSLKIEVVESRGGQYGDCRAVEFCPTLSFVLEVARKSYVQSSADVHTEILAGPTSS